MDDPLVEAKRKTVLLLEEDFLLANIEDLVAAFGYTCQKRIFPSKLHAFRRIEKEHWLGIEKELQQLTSSGNLAAALILFSKSRLFDTDSAEYPEVWFSLLTELKKVTSVIFLHEDNFKGRFIENDDLEKLIHTMMAASNIILVNNQDIFKVTDEIEVMINSIKKLLITCKQPLIEILQLYEDEEIKELISLIDMKISLFEFLTERNPRINNKITKKLYLDQLQDNPLLEQLRRVIMELQSHLYRFERNYVEKIKERSDKAMQLLRFIQASEIEIISYKKKTEISLWIHRFLDEIDKGIFLRLYVPNGRYQEDQLKSLLHLFESYLQRVEKMKFSIETRRTLHGQIYEFKCKDTIMNLTDLEVALFRFEQYMSLCQHDQKKAGVLLLKTGMNASEASRLLTKYMKEYQRLILDIEHERERKLLDIRQRLESEALDLASGTSLSVTQTVQPAALLSPSTNLDPIGITISNSSVIINPGLQSYVEQAIYGDIHYSPQDKELLDLFMKHGQGLEAVRLRSDLEQLKDTSSSEVERKTAKQKIMGFLAKVAPAIGQSALAVLTAYVEKLLTGS